MLWALSPTKWTHIIGGASFEIWALVQKLIHRLALPNHRTATFALRLTLTIIKVYQATLSRITPCQLLRHLATLNELRKDMLFLLVCYLLLLAPFDVFLEPSTNLFYCLHFISLVAFVLSCSRVRTSL